MQRREICRKTGGVPGRGASRACPLLRSTRKRLIERVKVRGQLPRFQHAIPSRPFETLGEMLSRLQTLQTITIPRTLFSYYDPDFFAVSVGGHPGYTPRCNGA